jgi:hypothetical protein
MLLVTGATAAAASLGAGPFGHDWSGGSIPGALAGVVIWSNGQ